jgi:hypothetical protein
MKKLMFRIGIVAVILLTAFPLVGQTTEVTPQRAEQVARTFWNLHHDGDVAKLNTPMYRLDTPWDAFYIFAPAEGKGFVIVAADDRVCPVLAYSFHNNAMRDKMSPSMSWWLDGWQQQVDDLRKEKGGERNEEWQQLLDGGGTPRSLTALEPMITTQWDQDAPYNDSCPTRIEFGSNVRALTGCVATAMAQVMKYWNYPVRGTGTHTYNSVSFFGLGYTFGEQTANFGATTYDWDNMPDHLTVTSPDVQKAAVATLMYHCGVACDMYYGSAAYGGSGTKIRNAPYMREGNALNGIIKYLGYSSLATGMERIKYDDNAWTALVRGELDASRPIIYAGFEQTAGHCFVCDGYDDEDRYHFNWGWSGDGDGFFTLNSLTPNIGSYTYDFTVGQEILVGIQPPTGDDSLCIIRQFPYTEDFETAPTGWKATSSNIRHSYSWMVVDSTGVDGNYSVGAYRAIIETCDDHMYSPSIVTPGDYKVNWQVRARQDSGSDSYTLTVGTETFNDIVESASWQPRELLFSVAEGDTVCLDFLHFAETNCVGFLIDNVVIEQMSDDYTITVSANPSDGGIVAGGGTYQQGQSCTVTATANEGYTFINWTENGVEVSTESSYTFTVTDHRTLVANFDMLMVEISAAVDPEEAASVNGAGTYPYGETITLALERNEDWAFVNWTEDGEVVSEEMTYTFVATESRDLVAHFVYTEGIGEQSANALVIYPNPVNDKLTLEAQEAIGTVEIYNLMGAMVYSQENCGNKAEIYIADLQRGVYFVHMMNDKVSETRKFVKE